MTPDRWQQQKSIFDAVRSATPADRELLLDRLCKEDAAMRAEVERLVADYRDTDTFLDEGAGALLSVALKPGDVLCDRFELLRLAGQGGMGQVWAARDRHLNETIAVKTINQRLTGDPAGADRFKRELQLARRIGHPNVCRCFELFEDNSVQSPRLFLTMELLEGETLRARLKREGRIIPAEAISIARQLAAGLHAAHTAGVVHRDLKPGNIMMASGAGSERAVIMDFGLARAQTPDASRGLTESGVVMGTPEYMAPEQIRGDKGTPATDVYALGLVIFEMLRGEPPFHGKSTLDSWMRRVREGPPKLAGLIPDLSPRIDPIIAKCLEYDPAQRFTSAEEAREVLEGSRRLPGEVPMWRQPLRVAAIAIAAALAVLGTVTAWQHLRPFEAPPIAALRWYEDAQRDLAEGATVRASRELQRAIAAAPRFAAVHAALAEAQLELDQVTLARESIQRATDFSPDRSRLPPAQALYIEGMNRVILRRCPEAIESLRARIAATPEPDRPYAMVSLARALERCDQPDQAREVLTGAARLDPRNAAVLVRAAFLANRRRDVAAAGKFLADAEALYRERANFEGVGEVLQTRGTFEAERDQLDAADATLGQALDLARTTGSIQQQIRVMFQQAIVARKRGHLAAAQQVTTRALELARQNDLETLALQGLFGAANMHLVQNQYPEAEEGFQRALDIATRYRDEGNQARAQLSLASLYVRTMQVDRAEEAITSAQPYYERIAHSRNIASALLLKGQVLFARADYAQAVNVFGKALELASQLRDSSLELSALTELATAKAETEGLPEAADLYLRALSIPRQTGRTRSEGYTLLSLSDTLSRLGRFPEAREYLDKAAQLMTGLERSAAADLNSRLLLVNAANSVRSGDYRAANRSLTQLMRLPDVPLPRLTDARLLFCSALSRSAATRQAIPHCESAIRQAEQSKDRRRLLGGRLLEAETWLFAGDPAKAGEIARSVTSELEWLDSKQDSWRGNAILARAAVLRGESPEEYARSASQIIAFLRLKWGEQIFRSWSKRADVSTLLRFLENKGRGK